MPQTAAQPALVDQEYIDHVIAEHSGKPGALLTVLERIQEHHPQKYLSAEALEYVAQKADIPLAQVYSVATFFALFNLEPQGRNTVCVCRGTACHTRGSRRLLDRLKLELGLHPHEHTDEGGDADKLSITTPDGKYTIRTVACFGQCALAPVVEINHEIFGHMNERALRTEIDEIEKESRKHAHPGHQQF